MMAIVTLIHDTKTTLCAECPDTVTITMPAGPPYSAGDELTCSSNGYPPATYQWTVDGSTLSTTSTQALHEAQHVYVCTATVDTGSGQTCSDTATRAVAAHSKYQKEYYSRLYTVTIIMLILPPT